MSTTYKYTKYKSQFTVVVQGVAVEVVVVVVEVAVVKVGVVVEEGPQDGPATKHGNRHGRGNCDKKCIFSLKLL